MSVQRACSMFLYTYRTIVDVKLASTYMTSLSCHNDLEMIKHVVRFVSCHSCVSGLHVQMQRKAFLHALYPEKVFLVFHKYATGCLDV